METGGEAVCSSIEDLSTSTIGTTVTVRMKKIDQKKTTNPSRETVFDWILGQVDDDNGRLSKPCYQMGKEVSDLKLSNAMNGAVLDSPCTLNGNGEVEAKDGEILLSRDAGTKTLSRECSTPIRIDSPGVATSPLDYLFKEISQKMIDLQSQDEHLSCQLMKAKSLIHQVSGVIAQDKASRGQVRHEDKIVSVSIKHIVPTVNAYTEYVQTETETETTSTDEPLPAMRSNPANGQWDPDGIETSFYHGQFDPGSSDSVSPIYPSMDHTHAAYQQRENNRLRAFAERSSPSDEQLSVQKKRTENRLWQFITQNSPLSGRRKTAKQAVSKRPLSKLSKKPAQLGAEAFGGCGVSEGKLNSDHFAGDEMPSQSVVDWSGRAASHLTLNDWLKGGDDRHLSRGNQASAVFRKMSALPGDVGGDTPEEPCSPPLLTGRPNNVTNFSALIRRKLGKKVNTGSNSSLLKFGPQDNVTINAVAPTQRPLLPSECYHGPESMRCTSLTQLDGWPKTSTNSPAIQGRRLPHTNLYNSRRQNSFAMERSVGVDNGGSTDLSKRKMKYVELKREPISGDVDRDFGIFSLDQQGKCYCE